MREEYGDYWKTYRAYGFAANVDGTLYLLSSLELLPKKYDPIPVMPDILLALLQIGQAYSRDEDIGLLVQEFCNRYGQLGFEQALVQKKYEDGSVKFYPDNVLGEKAASKTEFESIFGPFPLEQRRQLRRRVPERIEELPLSSNGEPAVLTLDYFSCEAVAWYGIYGRQLYDLLRRFQTGEKIVLLPGNVELQYELDDGTGQRKVYFDSLKSICDFYLMEMLVSKSPATRLCKRCGTPFLTHGKRTEYCSASCRNVMNVQNSRRRKKEQAEK